MKFWAANRQDHGLSLQFRCMVGRYSGREELLGKGFGHLPIGGPVHSLQKEQLPPPFSPQDNFKNSL